MKPCFTMVGASLILAAWAGDPAPGAAAQGVDETAILKLGVLTRTPSLDPHSSSLTTQPVHASAWDRLVRFDPTGQIAPLLATEWVWSVDGKSLTLTMVDDATFNDGTPVNAAAVVKSIERAKTDPNSRVASKFAQVASVVAESDTVVRFDLNSEGADLLWTLAQTPGSIINPTCIEKSVDLTTAPAECTSSAMVLAEGTPNGVWKLRHSPNSYWDDKAFKYGGIDFIPVGENEVVVNAMLAGDIDSAQLMGEGLARATSAISDGKLNGIAFTSSATRSLGLFLNPRVPPFDNADLRHAVQAAIDPVLLSQALFEGYCEPANQGVWTGSWAANKELESETRYDPEAVAKLLSAGGKPEGFEFSVFYQNTGSFNIAGQVMQAMLSQHGITMNLSPVQAGSVPAMVDGTAASVISAFGDPWHPANVFDLYTNLGTRRLAVVNGSDIEARVKELSHKAMDPMLSQEEQGKLWGQVWKAIYDDALTVPICQFREIWPTTTRLGNSEMENPEGPLWGPGFEVRYLTIAAE